MAANAPPRRVSVKCSTRAVSSEGEMFGPSEAKISSTNPRPVMLARSVEKSMLMILEVGFDDLKSV